MKTFLQSVANDVLFAVEFLGIVTLIFLLAYLAEKWVQKRQGTKEKIFTNRLVVAVLAIFCCALWGSATPFIKIGYELILPVRNTESTILCRTQFRL